MSSYKEGQVHQLVESLEKAGWTGDDLTRLGQYPDKKFILGVLRGTMELVVKTISFITHTYTILVDETKTVEELVADGKFDWSNDNIISKNFPKPENGTKSEKDMAIFNFGENISSENAIAKMDTEGYRPATIWELLAFAKKHPELQRQFPIVALGSVAVGGGNRAVAFLGRHGSRRRLSLRYLGAVWNGHDRFLAVRK